MKEDTNIENLKSKLQEELKNLEHEMNFVGRENPDLKGDWEVESTDLDTDSADESEVADKIEELEKNVAVMDSLERRYKEVKSALKKIDDGNYGICEVCSKKIEADRLEANPAACTCKEHM